MAENSTDEQRLEEFKKTVDSFKPEGFNDESWEKLKESIVNYHNDSIVRLKATNAEIKSEKEAEIAKRKAMEATISENAAQLKELNDKLASSQPEELKKFYETQQAQARTVFEKNENDLKAQLVTKDNYIKELETKVLKGEELAEFNKAADQYQWLDGARTFAQQAILGDGYSNFSRINLGEGQTLLANSNKDTIAQALKKFTETGYGKSLLRFTSSGGGADGSASSRSSGSKTISQAEYDRLSPDKQMELSIAGIEVV